MPRARASSDAPHVGAFAEDGRNGEGEVAFAGAHIHHFQRRGQAGFGHQMLKNLRKFFDLPEFGGHALFRTARAGGDAEGAQPGRIRGNRARLDMVVADFCPGFSRWFAGGQLGFATRMAGELDLGLVGEQMGIQKPRADQRLDDVEGRFRRMILGHVLGGVTPHQAQVRTTLELHRPHQQVFQGRLRAPVAAEGEFEKRGRVDRGSQLGTELFAGIHHSLTVRPVAVRVKGDPNVAVRPWPSRSRG